MKFYSDVLKKLYNTPEELEEAENQARVEEAKKKEKEASRKVRAKEVEDSFKNANELLNKFIADYGSFHMTFKNGNSIFDIFDDLF